MYPPRNIRAAAGKLPKIGGDPIGNFRNGFLTLDLLVGEERVEVVGDLRRGEPVRGASTPGEREVHRLQERPFGLEGQGVHPAALGDDHRPARDLPEVGRQLQGVGRPPIAA